MMRIKQILKSSSRDLRWQLFSLYLLSAALVFGTGLIFARNTNAYLAAETEFTDLALAQAIAQETQSALHQPVQAVQYLAAQAGVIEADPAQMAALFEVVHQTSAAYNLVYRLDQEGVMLFHYPAGVRPTVGQNFSFRPYSKRAKTTRSPFVSFGRISPTTERPVATVVMPLWAEAGQFLGIVAINIELRTLSQTLSGVVLQHNAASHLNITIVDSLGNILASLDPALLLTNIGDTFPRLSKLSKTAFLTQPGNSVLPDKNGQTFLLSYAPITDAGWSVVVSRPTDVAFAASFRFQRGFLLLMLLYGGGGLLFWLVLSKRMIEPIQAITTYIRNRPSEIPPPPEASHPLAAYAARSDQVGRLGGSLIETEKIIVARLRELRTLLETGTAVTSSLETETVLNTILVQVEQILEIDKSAIIAYSEAEQVFRISAGRGLSGRYEQRLARPGAAEGLARRALRQDAPLPIADLAQSDRPEKVAPEALAEGARAILAIPLKTIHAPPSVLMVYKTRPHTFTQREINLLSNFANHAAMALENATLYAQSDILLKEQTHRLEALVHSLGDGLVLEDLSGQIRYANRWLSEFTGLPPQKVERSSIADVLTRLHAQALKTKQVSSPTQTGDDRPVDAEIFALPEATGVRYLRSKVFKVTDYREKEIGRGLLLQDITGEYEIDRMKSLLISTVSHELRTPLAGIKGYATTLLADDVEWDRAEQHQFLEIISREADRLNRLVNELLDVTRLEAGRLKLEPAPCDLRQTTLRAVDQVYPPPWSRLRLEVSADLPPVFADRQRLEVVIRNLVENAVKYTDPETPITLSAALAEEAVVVKVSDRGAGIPEAHRRQIFDTFYRIENGLARQSGLGLGLAICQGFIQAQGGQIWLEPQDSGACIAFSLPVKANQETNEKNFSPRRR